MEFRKGALPMTVVVVVIVVGNTPYEFTVNRIYIILITYGRERSRDLGDTV